MPTIKDFGDFKITMYFQDHNPPHFHVDAGELGAQVRIEDLTILNGELPSGVLARVRRWANANRELIDSKWDDYSKE